jgi:pimeloyl-ACP methyl ester carboxylesterase
VGVRGIWAPDAAHQGASGILNEKTLGDDVSWNDHSRDIIHLANTFAEQLPPPIFGMGHSFGGHSVYVFSALQFRRIYDSNCCSRARASLYHPSLFTSLVLIDPVIEETTQTEPGPAASSIRRIDTWPSRAEAESYFRSRPFYQKWDPRCLEAQLVKAAPATHNAILATDGQLETWAPGPSQRHLSS